MEFEPVELVDASPVPVQREPSASESARSSDSRSSPDMRASCADNLRGVAFEKPPPPRAEAPTGVFEYSFRGVDRRRVLEALGARNNIKDYFGSLYAYLRHCAANNWRAAGGLAVVLGLFFLGSSTEQLTGMLGALGVPVDVLRDFQNENAAIHACEGYIGFETASRFGRATGWFGRDAVLRECLNARALQAPAEVGPLAAAFRARLQPRNRWVRRLAMVLHTTPGAQSAIVLASIASMVAMDYLLRYSPQRMDAFVQRNNFAEVGDVWAGELLNGVDILKDFDVHGYDAARAQQLRDIRARVVVAQNAWRGIKNLATLQQRVDRTNECITAMEAEDGALNADPFLWRTYEAAVIDFRSAEADTKSLWRALELRQRQTNPRRTFRTNPGRRRRLLFLLNCTQRLIEHLDDTVYSGGLPPRKISVAELGAITVNMQQLNQYIKAPLRYACGAGTEEKLAQAERRLDEIRARPGFAGADCDPPPDEDEEGGGGRRGGDGGRRRRRRRDDHVRFDPLVAVPDAGATVVDQVLAEMRLRP